MMQTLLRLMSDASTAWHRFWFSPMDPLPLCVMRLAVGAILLYTHLIWSIDLVGFFGASGWNNEGILATLQQDTLSWSLWWWVPQSAAYHFHVTCLAVLFLFWIGVATRVTSVMAWFITVSYAHRSMLANFGLDQISAMLSVLFDVGTLWSQVIRRPLVASPTTTKPDFSPQFGGRARNPLDSSPHLRHLLLGRLEQTAGGVMVDR